MRNTRRYLCAAAAVAAIGVAFPAGAAERGATLTIARPDEPLTLDPFIPADNGSIYAIAQICEPLVSADKPGTGLEPGLAESWEVSDDGLTYTFKLRDGLKFSDGTPVTVADAIFSLGKVSNPEAAYGFAFADITSTEETADGRLKVTLKKPNAAILSAMSLFAASVVSKAAYEKDPAAFGSKPVCTGPFQVESYERGTQLVLVPNPNYWQMGDDGKPLPYVEKAELKYVPESNSRVLGLQNGDFDVILAVPLNQAASIQSDGTNTLEVSPSYRLDYVYLNHAKPPFDNKNIRLAANYAANHPAIMQAVFFGYGETPNSFMPKVNFWSDKVEPIPFDMEKAKALVAEAGYDGTPIQLMVDTGNAPSRQVATILEQGWKEAGLNVEIIEADVGTAWGNTTKGDYQAYVSYITSDINDSDELATLQADHTGSTNAFFSWYKNDEVVDLLAKARATSVESERAALYHQIQDIVYHDGYSVPLNFLPYVAAHGPQVKDWKTIAVGWWWLKNVSLAE